MWFLASLITALGAAYAYDKVERFSEEVAIGCVVVAVGGLLLSVLSAPWPIQLLLLIGSLASYRFTKTNPLS